LPCVRADPEHFAELELSGYEGMWAWDGVMKEKVGVVGPNLPNLHLLWLTKCVEVTWALIVVVGVLLALLIALLCAHYVNHAF